MRAHRRHLRAVPLLVGAGALAAAALAAGPARAAGGASAPASLTPIACRSTLDPTLRRVAVQSTMGHLPGTRTLSVRLRLIEHAPGAAAQNVTGGDLDRWLTPAVPTLGRARGDVWRLTKPVYDVAAPATYRFRVEFRWTGAHGRIIARRTLATQTCSVRELRPDVLVRGVKVAPAPGHAALARDRYTATIANRGATASGPFSVLFLPGSAAASQTLAFASLAPHQARRVTFVGPVCDPAAPPTVVADPSGQVDDYDRANNSVTVTCPAAGAQSRSGPGRWVD